MFNKRHYEAIAECLQSCEPYIRDAQHSREEYYQIVVQKFANMFERDNARFQRNRFKAACQPGANVKLRTRYKVVAEWQQTGKHAWQFGNTPWRINWQGDVDGYWVDREGESEPRLPRSFKTLNAAKRFVARS